MFPKAQKAKPEFPLTGFLNMQITWTWLFLFIISEICTNISNV